MTGLPSGVLKPAMGSTTGVPAAVTGFPTGPKDPHAIHLGESLVTDATMATGPDNCPFLVNADKLDRGGDGLGDACHSLP